MDFATLYHIIQEAKFIPSETVRKTTHHELVKMISDWAATAFGHNNITTQMPYSMDAGGFVDIFAADRQISFQINGIIKFAPLDLRLPHISIGFDWDQEKDQDSRDASDKDPSTSYQSKIRTQPFSIAIAQTLRDKIIRPLSGYAVCIEYIAVGDRRPDWYASVMKSCGFSSINRGKSEWIPTSLYKQNRSANT